MAKKVKADKRPVFKRKGNEHQYEHNAAVLDKVDEAINFLNREGIAKTQESLKQGRNLILKRQKLIRLTDHEECGWDVVHEYLSDELASDSDDEKHIVRSRKAAAAKRKKSNSGPGGHQYKSYRQRPPYSSFSYQRGLSPQGSMYNAHNASPHSAPHFASQSDNKWAHSAT